MEVNSVYIERDLAISKLEENLLRGNPPANAYMESIIGVIRCTLMMLPALNNN